jgi:ubiquinone/menaquinone biosynthesis C-methylase UbiE
MDFYNQLADEYGELTGEAGRMAGVRAFVGRIMADWAPRSMLDVACGTGLFALEFARQGVAVTGADISEGMLDRARQNARTQGVDVSWLHAPMQELEAHLAANTFDLIICMGNSIPHLLDSNDLYQTVRTFRQHLSPGGRAVIHLLNYTRVLKQHERIVGISRNTAETEYVRFYDFDQDLLRFNVLKIQWTNERAEHALSTTTLRPYTRQDLDRALAEAGFRSTAAAADLAFSPFDENESDVLVLTAQA